MSFYEIKFFTLNSIMSRIFSFFLVFLIMASPSIALGDSTYFVKNIPVSAAAKNATESRNIAVSIARRNAFKTLLKRLELSQEIDEQVSDEEIANMVRSEQIDREKIAGNRYSATFNIMFAQDFVEHILSKKDLSELKPKQKTHLIIPARIIGDKAIIWGAENSWKEAITDNLRGKASDIFIVPKTDMANIAILNSDNVMFVDNVGLEPLLNKYDSISTYLLFFSNDVTKNRINIEVLHIKDLQKKRLKLSFINANHLEKDNLEDTVAKKTIAYLLSQNRESKILNSDFTYIGIPISSLGNWLSIKRRIERSGILKEMNIEVISKDFALISVIYTNPEIEMTKAFMKIGLPLTQKLENYYIID